MSSARPRVAVHGATGRLGRLIAAEAGPYYAGAIGRTGPVPDCDVVIDVSRPAGLAALLPRLEGQALLVGTTGDLPNLADYAATAPVAVVANFSTGLPVLLDLLARAVAQLDGWTIEIVETHHQAKVDAPSGTAKRLAQVVEQHTGTTPATHSLRIGDVVGQHTIHLAGPGERLELTHVATRREVFAIGALRWAGWLRGQPAGLVRA